MKELHMKDHEWSTRLAKSVKDTARSVNRGIRPARQSPACDLFTVYDKAYHIIDPVVTNGPVVPTNMIIMGTSFF